jgi:hypothetical protein
MLLEVAGSVLGVIELREPTFLVNFIPLNRVNLRIDIINFLVDSLDQVGFKSKSYVIVRSRE